MLVNLLKRRRKVPCWCPSTGVSCHWPPLNANSYQTCQQMSKAKLGRCWEEKHWCSPEKCANTLFWYRYTAQPNHTALGAGVEGQLKKRTCWYFFSMPQPAEHTEVQSKLEGAARKPTGCGEKLLTPRFRIPAMSRKQLRFFETLCVVTTLQHSQVSTTTYNLLCY